MKDYSEISTQEEMDALLARLSRFHDSMSKEFHMVNRGWVDEDRSMKLSHRFDGRLLIQSQWEVPAIELLFLGIESLVLVKPGEYWGAGGSVVYQEAPVERRRVSFCFDNALQITAARVFFRDRVDWLGQPARMGSEVPHDDCVPAVALEGRWRQCSYCADAFEACPSETYAFCPSCKQLTELAAPAAPITP